MTSKQFDYIFLKLVLFRKTEFFYQINIALCTTYEVPLFINNLYRVVKTTEKLMNSIDKRVNEIHGAF